MTKSNSAESAPNETSPLLTNDRLVSDTCDNIAGYDTNGSPSPSIEDGMLAEFKLILGYTLPLTGTYLLQYSYNIILLFVVASLGTTELAAVSVGVMTTNIIGYAIFEGIATSLDTLCSQAYGSGKYILVGVYVQQVFLLLMLVSVPIALLWVFSPFILVYLVKDQAVASMAGTFLGYSALGIPGYAAFEVGKRFLQAQGDFQGGFVALITSVPLLIFFNWLFVYVSFE